MTPTDSQAASLRIEPTRCNCHPETCGHWPYSLMLGAECITTGDKVECERLLGALLAWNTRPREDAGVVEYTTGHCANNNRLGGCQLHNLHCGYPECDRKPVESTQARQPVARPDLNDMDAARLAWVAKNWCSPVGREFAMHVLKRGGTGDLGDIRSFVDEQLKAALAAALGKSNG